MSDERESERVFAALRESQVSGEYLNMVIDKAQDEVLKLVDSLPPGDSTEFLRKEFNRCFDEFIRPVVEKARESAGAEPDALFPAMAFYEMLAGMHAVLPIAVATVMGNASERDRTAAIMVGNQCLAAVGSLLLVDMGLKELNTEPCPECGDVHPW